MGVHNCTFRQGKMQVLAQLPICTQSRYVGRVQIDVIRRIRGIPRTFGFQLNILDRVVRFSSQNIPKWDKIYQTTTKYTKWLNNTSNINLKVVNVLKVLIPRPYKMCQNLDCWYANCATPPGHEENSFPIFCVPLSTIPKPT
jgi:cobalamin biosynthesis Mg chelatase CobN